MPALPGKAGIPSRATATGSMAAAAARNCTAVTATGSRPRSRPVCATVNVADISKRQQNQAVTADGRAAAGAARDQADA